MSDSTPTIRSVPHSGNEVDVSDIPDNPDALVREIGALNAMLRSVGQHSVSKPTVRLVQAVFAERLHRSSASSSIEGRGISAAMAKILGEKAAPFASEVPVSSPWERVTTATVVAAWIAWADGYLEQARALLSQVDLERHPPLREGAINLMALGFWVQGIEHLLQGDKTSSKRFWQRAIEMGAHFGTESHLLVSWTYAASFFPHS